MIAVREASSSDYGAMIDVFEEADLGEHARQCWLADEGLSRLGRGWGCGSRGTTVGRGSGCRRSGIGRR